MPSATRINIIPLHPTFVAEVQGIDWTKPVDQETFAEIKHAIDKYGVLIFRNTGLDDERHIAFSENFGELDDMMPHVIAGRKLRIPDPRMFDVSNLDLEGNVVNETSPERMAAALGNNHWHADLAFNSRRTGYSLLRGEIIPPKGLGGATEYLDARTAYEELPDDMKAEIQDLVANNSLWHNRKIAAPEFFKDLEPEDFPMSKHKIVVPHVQTGRTTLYLTTYCHHFDGMSFKESQELIDKLFLHLNQPKYRQLVEWENDGDLVLWDNTAVLHRGTGGAYLGKHARDMRRTSVYDMGPYRHGMNDPNKPFRQGMPMKKDKW